MGIGKVIDINQFILQSEKGIDNGIPTLDLNGFITGNQINLASLGISGVLPVANGGTGNSGLPANKLLLSDYSTSANLNWDNTNNYLGIGNGIPSNTLDVFGTSRFSGVSQFTSTTESTSELTGAINIPNGGIGIGGNCYVKGFIISDIAYKVMKIEGMTPAVGNTSTVLPLSVDITKIISIVILVDYSINNSSTWICSGNKGGFQFNTFIDGSGQLKVELTGSSGSILNKRFVGTIIYTD